MNHNTEISSVRYFDLRLDRTEHGATATVINSPAGQSTSPVAVNSLFELTNLQVTQLTAEDQIGLGITLWQSLFGPPEIAELWRASHAAGSPYLRLTIGDPELASLPWELMYDTRTDKFVALDGQAALIRFLPLPIGIVASPVELPLRILFTGSSPAGLQRIDVDKECKLLADALPKQALTLLGSQESVTLSRLAADLMAGAVVWHFAGHGTEQALILDDGAGNPVTVDAFTLGMLLTGSGVRVALVNSCRAGAGGAVVSSVAGALLRAGIPSVVAMQSEITDEAAFAFCKSFYQAIALGRSVEQATTSARRAVYGLGKVGGTGWWMPALFSRNDIPLVLVNAATVEEATFNRRQAASSHTQASGGSAISQGGLAISGTVGGSVVTVSSSKS